MDKYARLRKYTLMLICTIVLLSSGYIIQGLKPLQISAPATVIEGQQFTVIVRSNGTPVMDATVIFIDHPYVTGYNGSVILTAPSVTNNTIYPINASKPGYTSTVKMITVTNIMNNLVIDAPSSVYEGDTFNVHVSDEEGHPINHAAVIFWNQTYYTFNGSAFLTAPLVEETVKTTIHVSAWEYYPATVNISIIDTANSLIITAPSSVLEQSFFLVTVTDTNSNLIDNASVLFFNTTYYTQNGHVSILAPSVDYSIVVELIAEKEGYLPGSTIITILDNITLPILSIYAPEQVQEGSSFLVRVTSENYSVPNATVTFLQTVFYTNAFGNVTLTAPSVATTTQYSIQAQKGGYQPAPIFWITVLNTNSPTPSLSIDAPAQVMEGNTFSVLITADGYVVANAAVTFNGVTSYTNSLGSMSLTSPSVTKTSSYIITAIKAGYLSASRTITILDQKQLVIVAPSTVNEGDLFDITITANNQLLPQAAVSFNRIIYYTDAQGKTTLTAPFVLRTTSYQLSVTKEGYTSAETLITIVHQETIQGRIEGTVSLQGAPLPGVEVCVLLSIENNTATSQCTFTGSDGSYSLVLLPGVYTAQAQKQGYKTFTQPQVSVVPNQITKLNIALEIEPPTENISSRDETTVLAEYTIQTVISAGYIGAKIAILPSGIVPTNKITYYIKNLTITMENITDSISFTVRGNESVTGTFILVFIGKDVLSSSDLMVYYDHQKLEKMPLSQFLNPQSLTEPAYVLLLTKEGNYVGVYFPHFSEHTVTISPEKVVEALGGIPAVVVYVVALVIVALVYLFPILFVERKK